MKRFASAAVRAVFGSLLAAGLLAAAQADESTAKERKDFRDLLKNIAERSQDFALSCKENRTQGQPQEVAYRIDIKDEPQYAGAYFLVFSPIPDGRKWSTLIAYEGKRGFVMGNLTVNRKDRTVFYQHAFRGFLSDITRLVVRDGQPTELRYMKIGTAGKPVIDVACAIK